MIKNIKFILICILFILAIDYASALSQNFVNAKLAAMGQSCVGSVKDASAILTNSAGLVWADKKCEISLGGYYRFSKISYQEPRAINTFNSDLTNFTPQFFARFNLLSRLALGFGYTQFYDENNLDWYHTIDEFNFNDLSQNLYYGYYIERRTNWPEKIKSELKTDVIHFAISAQLLKKLSLGVVLNYYDVKFKETNIGFNSGYIPGVGWPLDTLLDKTRHTFENNESGNSLLFQVGLMYQFNQKLNFGLNFNSKLKANLTGTTHYDALAYASEFEIEKPPVYSIGAMYQPTNKVRLSFQVDFIHNQATNNWTRSVASVDSSVSEILLDDLIYDYNLTVTDTTGIDLLYEINENHTNTYAIKGGLEYQFKDNIALRFGIDFRSSYLENRYLSIKHLDIPMVTASAGFGWDMGFFTLDFAAYYSMGQEKRVLNNVAFFHYRWRGLYDKTMLGTVINISKTF